MHQFPDHPDISTALATGYHKLYKPLLCDTCKEVIRTDEPYGECDGRKTCYFCIESEWEELTIKEKFVALGYNAKFNG